MKKMALISTNTNFFGNLEKAFLNAGCEIQKYNHTTDVKFNYLQIGRLTNWCDFVFVDFAQDPLSDLLKYCDKPIVVRLHRIEVYNSQISSWDWSKVNLLIFIADHVKQRFEEQTKYSLKYSPQKMVVLPEGVDISKFVMPETPRTYKLPLKIGMTGRIVPKKRFYTAIQLLGDIVYAQREKMTSYYQEPELQYELHIAGSYANPFSGYGNVEYYQNCLDLITALNLQDRVNFLGHIQDMSKFYQNVDFFLSLSNEEGYHASVMEAMACGCIPMVHCWKGAEDIYSEFIFKGFEELIGNFRSVVKEMRIKDMTFLSSKCREMVCQSRDAEKLSQDAVAYILREI